MMKRLLDLVVAGLGVIVLSPLLMFVALLVKCTSAGPILFRHERIGKGFRPFKVLKFRTMVRDAAAKGGPITFGDDPRITRVGRTLRKTKIDELPQLFNVLKGDMSLVGPRPEVGRYVAMFRTDYEEILRVRPGITDLASIEYRDEAKALGKASDPEVEYTERVLPEKIRLAKEYLRRQSLLLDLGIVIGTLFHLAHDRTPRQSNSAAHTELTARPK
jgi:lipopolysaccharide/colanic/teichoic acid biosynthesis glycosyltransferase